VGHANGVPHLRVPILERQAVPRSSNV
jgi:hypothetical protein